MSGIAVNNEGVAALKKMSSDLTQALEDIENASKELSSIATDQNGLGVHVNTINDLLDQIEQALKDAKDPVNTLSSKLLEVADGYQEMIDNDPYAGLNP